LLGKYQVTDIFYAYNVAIYMANTEKGYDIPDAMMQSFGDAARFGMKSVALLLEPTINEVREGVGKYIVQQKISEGIKGADHMRRQAGKIIFQRNMLNRK
jgi:hypothetical protein